jgi:hypothetical protein
MTKEELLQQFAAAYEQLIATASQAAQHGITNQLDGLGPRETVAHMAGWEIMATVRIPAVIAGMPPIKYLNETQATVMDNALNAAFVALIGEQPLEPLSALLRQAYQRVLELLKPLDDTYFQPGQYIYEHTREAIEHCQGHMEMLTTAFA